MSHDNNSDHLEVCMTCRITAAISNGHPDGEALPAETGSDALNALGLIAAFLLAHGTDKMAEEWADWVLEEREKQRHDGFGLAPDGEASLQ